MLKNVVHATLIRLAGTVHDVEDAVANSLIKRGLATPDIGAPASAGSPDATPPASGKLPPKAAK